VDKRSSRIKSISSDLSQKGKGSAGMSSRIQVTEVRDAAWKRRLATSLQRAWVSMTTAQEVLAIFRKDHRCKCARFAFLGSLSLLWHSIEVAIFLTGEIMAV
jgi:hypothetical protein